MKVIYECTDDVCQEAVDKLKNQDESSTAALTGPGDVMTSHATKVAPYMHVARRGDAGGHRAINIDVIQFHHRNAGGRNPEEFLKQHCARAAAMTAGSWTGEHGETVEVFAHVLPSCSQSGQGKPVEVYGTFHIGGGNLTFSRNY